MAAKNPRYGANHIRGNRIQAGWPECCLASAFYHLTGRRIKGWFTVANVLDRDKQLMALHLLVEGNSLRAITRLTGIHRTTVMNLMVRAGEGCQTLLDERLRNLTLNHVECDEIWTFVGKKQARLTMEERQSRHDIGDANLWTALDQKTKKTKLVATYALGKRSADMARRLMMDLAKRLQMPNPHASDRHAYEHPGYRTITQVSTDGFTGYPEAVDLAFGPYVKFGTIVKDYRNADRKPGNYSPSEMIGTQRKGRRNIRESELDTICTSHVERHNLTIRTFMKRFARLSLGFSKKFENLAAATHLFMAYYNFCWKPKTLNGITPAMAASVENRIWKISDLQKAIG